jgi:hypothetical protein
VFVLVYMRKYPKGIFVYTSPDLPASLKGLRDRILAGICCGFRILTGVRCRRFCNSDHKSCVSGRIGNLDLFVIESVVCGAPAIVVIDS